MKFLEKLTSKKGQVSMEIGILVAAAVAVAAIAAYFYAKNVKDSQANVAQAANNTANALADIANDSVEGISSLDITGTATTTP
ncbi:uncharacterized protein (UPF0333 family) [Methanococcus maripaludis]|uniref:Uncharacterized protein (UPF0333 family) n=1 Tax=Methanococcus maripaludis TaxID=39152 RepID=A0A7J9P7G7_METMI|nr:class III signal peptide-containing protein [Methanococcus maripaludis]MBA2857339.1 uncharacterized protein (UPF0333 family) [Methanococcus maripaludis]